MMAWSVLAGLVEGQFASVVVAKTFHASELLLAISTATPTAANLVSLVWGMLCVGRPKIALASLFAAGTALCAATAGAVPTNSWGCVWFIVQLAAAQVLLAGTVTVRSAIWKANYPQSDRGRITARIQGVRFVIAAGSMLLAAWLCDRHPSSYRIVFPTAGLFGLVSILSLSRIHIRHERRQLGRIGTDVVDADSSGRQLPPYSLTTLISPGKVFGQMFRVLRNDRRYLQYCYAQICNGMSNLLTISIVVAVVTRDLVPDDARGFWISVVLVEVLPKTVMLGSLRRWGQVFDRLGVLGMRELNLGCWTVSILFGMFGDLMTPSSESIAPTAFLLGVLFFTLRAIAMGLGQGGGALGWNIGHLHFASGDEAEVYMGIHVFFTGVRGLVAPLGGMWLWRTMGWPVWLVAVGFSVASFWIYSSMARAEVNESKVLLDQERVL
ncbi:MAG: hypothetical protein AABZ47_08475 [Planctomycetota bacterium]